MQRQRKKQSNCVCEGRQWRRRRLLLLLLHCKCCQFFIRGHTHTRAHLLEHTCTHTHIQREKEKERERVRERNYPIAVPNELNFHFFAPTVSQAQPSVRLPLLMSLWLWLGFLVELLQRCQIHHKPARAAINTGQRSARQSAQLEEDSPKLASAR